MQVFPNNARNVSRHLLDFSMYEYRDGRCRVGQRPSACPGASRSGPWRVATLWVNPISRCPVGGVEIMNEYLDGRCLIFVKASKP